MNFALSIIVLTLVVALICFYPLLRSVKAKEDKKRDELNKALYFSRLKEIEQDNQQGLVENVEQLKQELQKTLLEDIPQQETQTIDNNAKNYGKLWFVSGLLGLSIIAAGAYFPLGSWKAEDMMEKTLAKLSYFFERIKEEDTNPMTDAEMQQFSTALRLDLQKTPKDAKKWWLLGQVGMNLGNGKLAFDSYQQANKLEPDNFLREIIRQDHSNPEALSLLAFSYFEGEDYKMAAVTWAMMLRLLEPDDPRVPMLEKSIRAARDALALQEEEKAKSITPEK